MSPKRPAAPATTKRAPKTRKPATRKRDPRLPAPGGVIEKTFKGRTIRVQVTADGFACDGQPWSSLTALALHLTGYKAVSGPAFFGLTKPPAPEAHRPPPPAPAKRKAGRPIAPRRSK